LFSFTVEDAESYITREAAKELRTKLGIGKHHEGSPVEPQFDDYDEILKEIIRNLPKQQQQQPEVIYDKKYFDYLPNEISDSDDVTSEELSHELVKMVSEYISAEDEQKQQHQQHMLNNDGVVREGSSGKTKRDVQQEEKKTRSKRQSIYYAMPLSHYNPYPNVHFYFPIHDPIFNSFPNTAAESRRDFAQVLPNPNYNNPWTPQNNPHMKFHSPGNFYLPPSTPSPTYLPAGMPQRPPVK
jgi:hypothetical protein